MTHDPMCPNGNPRVEAAVAAALQSIGARPSDYCNFCPVIARVRQDERAAALRDAVEAIEAVDPPSEAYDDWHPKGKRLALAAIEALGGER